jgi:cytochrome c oxidase subunit 2
MKFAALLFAAVALVACGTEEDTGLVGDVTAGETIWTANNCASCHGADGKSGSAGENIVNSATNEVSEFTDTVANGKDNGAMPAFPDLSDQDLADLAAYVATL